MNIRERAEGTLIEDGAQVTSTRQAQYFIFKHKSKVVTVRMPKFVPEEDASEIEVVENELE